MKMQNAESSDRPSTNEKSEMETKTQDHPANVAAPEAKGGSTATIGSASKWYRKYRIVRDLYAGYEVQCWRLWLPIWLQCGFCNTHGTVEKARAYAIEHANNEDVVASNV